MEYFGVFLRFLHQNSELQAKHTISLRNLNISKRGYFAFYAPNSEMQAKHYIC
ncbi:hypothetical protein E2C01_050587 [Portunus trituberculatus]|uniref:Uncharacterized protein n=1 Tax=Portunus trituberculatus TaxID=210409 RepID=A0A5B7GCI3_PORTR|nr:hypothetical protein [Portunus trituberculatus]